MIKKLFGIGLEERVNALEEDFKNLKIEVDKNSLQNKLILDKINKIEKELIQLKNDVAYLIDVVGKLQSKKVTAKDKVKIAILEMLKNSDLTASQIIKRLPNRSNTTIYNALKELETEGKITKYQKFNGKRRNVFYKLIP